MNGPPGAAKGKEGACVEKADNGKEEEGRKGVIFRLPLGGNREHV